MSDVQLPMNGADPLLETLRREIELLRNALRNHVEVSAQTDLLLHLLLRRVGTPGICNGLRCRARILWVVHANGAKTPYDQNGRAHFETCPDHQHFHKRRTQ